MEKLLAAKAMIAALMHQHYLGMPARAWLLGSMPAINEAINRAHWTRAQTIWQAGWRIVHISPLGRLPMIGAVI